MATPIDLVEILSQIVRLRIQIIENMASDGMVAEAFVELDATRARLDELISEAQSVHFQLDSLDEHLDSCCRQELI